jgi:FkbM family methyltransferase
MTIDELQAVHRIDLPDGRTIACTNPQDAQIWPGLLEDSPYDDGLAALSAGDLVLDVGAHIGLTALYFTDRVPGVGVIAFEPAPETYACLADNAARLMPGVKVLNVAVGAEAGTAELTFYPRHTMMATLVVDEADDAANMSAVLTNFGLDEGIREQVLSEFRDGERRHEVPVVALGDVIEEYGIDEVGLLKIDVERGELAVLRGIRDDQWARVRQVVAEVHDIDGNLDAVVELLRKQGFDTEVRQEAVFVGGSVHVVFAARGDFGGAQ